MRKIIYLFLSIFLVIAPTIQQANAASSWSITGAISAGSRSIVSATKGGYKSAVNIAPSAGRLGMKLIKGGNMVALGLAVANILGDGVTWVLDPANNAVKYKKKTDYACNDYFDPSTVFPAGSISATATYICGASGVADKYANGPGVTVVMCNNGYTVHLQCGVKTVDAYLPISQVAARVIANARNGHAPSQAATRETATEMVVSGDFDADLMSGAVPISDNKPLVPSVPISGNGNVTHGSDVGIGEDGMSGATPGQIGDAAKDAADASKRAADAAKDAAKAAQDAAREASDAAQDLVNSGADQAAIDAANDRAAAAEKAAADAKAQAERAAQAANDRAVAAERAAQAATAAAQAAAAQAAKDLAAAIAAGDAAAKAAAEAAKAAADKAVAEAKAKQEAAEKAAEKAKAEAAKPFELPAFCSWATPVCDFIDWFKKTEELPPPTPIPEQDINLKSPVDFDKSYINAPSQCPPDVEKTISVGSNSFSFVIPMTPVCDFGANIINPVLYFIALIQAAFIIGSAFKVG